MKTTRTIHRPGAALALGFSLVMSACGGNTGDTTGSTSDTSAATTDGTTAPSTDGTSTTAPATGTSTDATTATSTPTTGTDATTADATGTSTTGGQVEPSLSFFVSSTGSPTGNLGGLEGADQRCQDLADAVGAGDKTWHAYLSVENGPDDQPIHARDRIGQGPWYNAELVMVAADLAELHTKDGDPALFLDENGEMVPGQWDGSPDPNEHDILTGSNKDGTVTPGRTCADWTSEDPTLFAQVGHSDGLGPMGSDAEEYRSWNSVHESGGCNDTAPKGGAGRVYCFAID
ncbi:hypothetical protein SAMN02745121_08050 [Nannocystis exedens]|uniref:DUF1554 domain-containing protein n=1 Tax=Nannocystis exedens TaxID=54 RepID=A0A1I2HM74_9BACT|nr:hypothetical protein [Nannocystis exedens]PCC71966.1 hypothetical protein NAEX_05045 [Nannocystis exedens]SFF30628.1 hypothetical protein SAMN02745121_08050 [Nannocystis exedens]